MTERKKITARMMVSDETGVMTTIGDSPPPEGWVPDTWIQTASNTWVPTWPACRHRRLSIEVIRGKPPVINVHCNISGELEDVSADICKGCDKFIAPQQAPPIALKNKMMKELLARDFPEHFNKTGVDAKGRKIEYMSDHPLHGYDDKELEEIEETIFQREMEGVPQKTPNPHHPGFINRTKLRWNVPCVYRIKVKKTDEESDCGGCGDYKIVCDNKDAEAYGQKLRRRICKECPCPKRPPEKEMKLGGY